MVTREINAEIPQDRSILRHIVRDLNQNLGVYARIVQPGTIALNDTISFQ
jgi:MOSC domain-containing protein YiiM